MYIKCLKSLIDIKSKLLYSCFCIQNLNKNFGVTLGNLLRRILLLEIFNFTITNLTINKLIMPFSNIPGLKETFFEFIVNIQKIIFKENISNNSYENHTKVFLHKRGPIVLNAGMFISQKPFLTILNTRNYLGTLVNSSDFYVELEIIRKNFLNKNMISDLSNIGFSMNYTCNPVKRVNYAVEIASTHYGLLKESLILNIWTTGALTPRRCFYEGLKKLQNYCSTLLNILL